MFCIEIFLCFSKCCTTQISVIMNDPFHSFCSHAVVKLACKTVNGNRCFRCDFLDGSGQVADAVVYEVSENEGYVEMTVKNLYGQPKYVVYGKSRDSMKMSSAFDWTNCKGYIQCGSILDANKQQLLKLENSSHECKAQMLSSISLKPMVSLEVELTAVSVKLLETIKQDNLKCLIVALALNFAWALGSLPTGRVPAGNFFYTDLKPSSVSDTPLKIDSLALGSPSSKLPPSKQQTVSSLREETDFSPASPKSGLDFSQSPKPQETLTGFESQPEPGSAPKTPLVAESEAMQANTAPCQKVEVLSEGTYLTLDEKKIIGRIDRPTPLMDFYCLRYESKRSLKLFNQSIPNSYRAKQALILGHPTKNLAKEVPKVTEQSANKPCPPEGSQTDVPSAIKTTEKATFEADDGDVENY